MRKLYLHTCSRAAMACLFMLAVLSSTNFSFAQIYSPEGLNIVGAWNGWTNLPTIGSPFGSEFQRNGGVKLITTGVRRWHATVPANATGTTEFLFLSCADDADPWNPPGFNKWGGVNPVNLNTVQPYTLSGVASNNFLSTTSGKYYTTNWQDQGYVNTNAVWMETTNVPVTITSTTQSPLAGNVTPTDPVDVTVTTSGSLSPEEKVYIRWTTDNYNTVNNMLQVTMVGNSGTAQISAQPDGATVQYYVMTSTGTTGQIATNYDMFTLNSGVGQSYTSTALLPVNITFLVDMQNEAVSGDGVHIAGSFNGFNPSATALTLISGTTYGVTLSLAQNSTIQYKFINGDAWGEDESVPGACASGGNREFTVGNGNATVPSHCYGKCLDCVPAVPVTFRVNMSGLTVSGNGVHIAGNFGSLNPVWDPAAIAMTNMGGGIYQTVINIVPGTVVQYKYINGNSWGNEEGVPGACNVSGNRQITTPASAYTVPLNCFGTCSNCVSVTFRVNMSGQTISGNGIHVAGSFQSWNPGSTALSPIGGDVYEATIKMDPNTSFQYKFVNGNSWGTDESVPGLCQTSGNRTGSVATSNKVLSTVCFGRCIDCGATSVWTGQADGNFNNGNNWTAGVPPTNCSFVAHINKVNNQPTISSGTFSAGSLSLQKGVVLTNGGTLNVCGNITGSSLGSAITGSGTVVLNGTGMQTISGSQTFSNLRIDNSAGVSLASGALTKITGALKLQNGLFNASSGTLKFMASAGNQARMLKTEPGASFNGNIVFQKKFAAINPADAGAWFFVGSPVDGFSLESYFQDGNTFAPATFLPANQNPGSLYLYDQTSTAIDNDFGWVKSSNQAQVPNTGLGVRMWAKKVFTSNEGIIEYTGVPNSGTVNFPISFCASGCSYPANGATNGWNFLANPYPCPIDWNAGTGWNKTGIAGNAIYVWNADQETYATYDGAVGTNGGTQNIASGQAFFVEATSGVSVLQANENAKTDVNTAGLRKNVADLSGLNITLSSGNATDNVWLDLSSNRLDVAVTKLTNPGMNLALSGMLKNYAIAGKNTVATNNMIPLSIRKNGMENKLVIEKKGPEVEGYTIYLRDDVNNTLTELTETTTEVTFTASNSDENRFSLVFTESVTAITKASSETAMKVWPNPTTNVLMVERADVAQPYTIATVTGKTISSGTLEAGSQVIKTQNLPAGPYIIRFTNLAKTARFVKF